MDIQQFFEVFYQSRPMPLEEEIAYFPMSLIIAGSSQEYSKGE